MSDAKQTIIKYGKNLPFFINSKAYRKMAAANICRITLKERKKIPIKKKNKTPKHWLAQFFFKKKNQEMKINT